MAVYQISRIQLRRGKASTGTGLPQLASGELAWAIDTQELYIGNGAVSEGAPAVGNTKVLTQNDLAPGSNLMNLVQRIYQRNGVTTTSTNSNGYTPRSLQDLLDAGVSVADFGAVGDGMLVDSNDPLSGYEGTDNTAAIQLALNQLYLNTTPASNNDGASIRVTLSLPAGIFITTKTLYVPSFVTIVGAGPNKSVIAYNPSTDITGTATALSTTIATTAAETDMVGATITGTGIPANTTVTSVTPGVSLVLNHAATVSGTQTFNVVSAKPAMQFVNDESTVDVNDPSKLIPSAIDNSGNTTQPRHISFSNFSIETVTGQNTALQLDAVRDSTFENMSLSGYWGNNIHPLSIGIVLNANTSLVTSERNIFRNINIEGFSYGVASYHDINENYFTNLSVSNAEKGIVLGYNVAAGINSTGGYLTNQAFGARSNTVVDTTFENIRKHGYYLGLGYDNVVRDCKFTNVGTLGGASPAAYPQVYFTPYRNVCHNIMSDRHAAFARLDMQSSYVPEVAGHAEYVSLTTQMIPIGAQTISQPAQTCFRLPVPTLADGSPAGSITYTVKYLYKSTSTAPGIVQYSRHGLINIVADVDNLSLQLADDYEFAGTDPDGSLAQIIDFTARFLDQTGTHEYTGALGQTLTSIELRYSNHYANDYGVLYYSYKSLF